MGKPLVDGIESVSRFPGLPDVIRKAFPQHDMFPRAFPALPSQYGAEMRCRGRGSSGLGLSLSELGAACS